MIAMALIKFETQRIPLKSHMLDRYNSKVMNVFADIAAEIKRRKRMKFYIDCKGGWKWIPLIQAFGVLETGH